MSSAYFDPDTVVFDGFDYTFGIKWTLVCRQSCMKDFYEILTEFIQLKFFKWDYLPLANSQSGGK